MRRVAQALIDPFSHFHASAEIKKTPARFEKAWREIMSGYDLDPKKIVGSGLFRAPSKSVEVTLENLPFYSVCEHHLLPFFGTFTIRYIPQKKLLGLSKFPRLIDIFSRRMQLQERLTHEVYESLKNLLDPRSLSVESRARHLCMEMRGARKVGSETICKLHF